MLVLHDLESSSLLNVNHDWSLLILIKIIIIKLKEFTGNIK